MSEEGFARNNEDAAQPETSAVPDLVSSDRLVPVVPAKPMTPGLDSTSASSALATAASVADGADLPAGFDPEGMAALKNLEEKRRREKRNRIIKVVVACCIVAAAVAAWFIVGAMNNASQQQEFQPSAVAVTRADLSTTVQATGALKPGSHVTVTPEVPGIVQDVMVAEGQHVEAGDVLFTLKNDELDKTLSDAASALDKARRDVDVANAGVSNEWNSYYAAIDEYNAAVDRANAGLGEDPGAFDHSGYLSSIDSANSSLTAAYDAVDSAQRNYDYALEQANKRTVRAPCAGTVLDLKAIPGASVGGATGGTSAADGALLQIADLTRLSVDVEVNEIDIANVKPGQRARFTFTAVPDLMLEGEVSSVASVATSASSGGTSGGGGVVTFKVTAVISAPSDRLKPGMSASVTIVTEEMPDVLVVPSSALIEDGQGAYVLVVADEKSTDGEMRPVIVAGRSGSQVAVESGLEEGELVLVGSSAPNAESASASPIG